MRRHLCITTLAAIVVLASCGGSGIDEAGRSDEVTEVSNEVTEVSPSWAVSTTGSCEMGSNQDCAVAADANRAYFADMAAADVAAYDLGTGAEVWRTQLETSDLPTAVYLDVVDETVLVEAHSLDDEGSSVATLTGIGAATGALVWATDATNDSGFVWRGGGRDALGRTVATDGVVLVGPTESEDALLPVTGLEVATGEPVWSAGGGIIDSCEGVVYTLTRPEDSAPDTASDTIEAVDVATGDVLYDVGVIGDVLPGGGCTAGYLLTGVAGDAGSTVTIDPTGTSVSGTLVGPSGGGSLFAMGGVVYLSDDAGVYRVDPATGELTWSIDQPLDGTPEVEFVSDELASLDGPLFDPRSGDVLGTSDEVNQIVASDGDTTVISLGGRYVGVVVTDDHTLLEQYTLQLDNSSYISQATAAGGVIVAVTPDEIVAFTP